MFKCAICESEWPTLAKMIKHVNNKHRMKTREYFELKIKMPGDGICRCGNPTKFKGMNGYRPHCSKSCACTHNRELLRADADKFRQFKDKVSTNMETEWAERKKLGADVGIWQKISGTMFANSQKLTKEERSDHYGWLNKLSEEDRRQWISNVMLTSGAHAWWSKADIEDKKKVVIKRLVTRFGGIDGYNEYYSMKDCFAAYSSLVRALSNNTYKEFRDLINPEDLPRGNCDYHLDHICSVKECFINDIPPNVAASYHNLQMLPSGENLTKSTKSDQTATQLMEKYNGKI